MTDKKEPMPEMKAEEKKLPDQLLREFLAKEGLTLVASPEFVSTNHGSFEVKVSIGVRRK